MISLVSNTLSSPRTPTALLSSPLKSKKNSSSSKLRSRLFSSSSSTKSPTKTPTQLKPPLSPMTPSRFDGTTTKKSKKSSSLLSLVSKALLISPSSQQKTPPTPASSSFNMKAAVDKAADASVTTEQPLSFLKEESKSNSYRSTPGNTEATTDLSFSSIDTRSIDDTTYKSNTYGYGGFGCFGDEFDALQEAVDGLEEDRRKIRARRSSIGYSTGCTTTTTTTTSNSANLSPNPTRENHRSKRSMGRRRRASIQFGSDFQQQQQQQERQDSFDSSTRSCRSVCSNKSSGSESRSSRRNNRHRYLRKIPHMPGPSYDENNDSSSKILDYSTSSIQYSHDEESSLMQQQRSPKPASAAPASLSPKKPTTSAVSNSNNCTTTQYCQYGDEELWKTFGYSSKPFTPDHPSLVIRMCSPRTNCKGPEEEELQQAMYGYGYSSSRSCLQDLPPPTSLNIPYNDVDNNNNGDDDQRRKFGLASLEDQLKYGYGDATPDTEDNNHNQEQGGSTRSTRSSVYDELGEQQEVLPSTDNKRRTVDDGCSTTIPRRMKNHHHQQQQQPDDDTFFAADSAATSTISSNSNLRLGGARQRRASMQFVSGTAAAEAKRQHKKKVRARRQRRSSMSAATTCSYNSYTTHVSSSPKYDDYMMCGNYEIDAPWGTLGMAKPLQVALKEEVEVMKEMKTKAAATTTKSTAATTTLDGRVITVDSSANSSANDAAAASLYGYEEAVPDSSDVAREQYGYGEASPDVSSSYNENINKYSYEPVVSDSSAVSRGQYEYGDASPDVSRSNNDKYGYEPAVPDSSTVYTAREQYGYGDASPDEKYGYGSAAPDSAVARQQYGYGPAEPDYGYGDASPDNKTVSSSNKYGYEAAAPDYGYGDASPDEKITPTPRYQHNHHKTSRRSSMKSGGAPRRASLQFGGGHETEVSLRGGRKVTRRSSITFSETPEVRSVQPAKDLTDNPSDLWIQANEMKKIKAKAKHDANYADIREERADLRGLEKYVGARKAVISERKVEAWDSVLVEQHLQESSGEYNDEYIADVYKFATVDTQKEANARALKDMKEIEAYLRNTRKQCRRMSM